MRQPDFFSGESYSDQLFRFVFLYVVAPVFWKHKLLAAPTDPQTFHVPYQLPNPLSPPSFAQNAETKLRPLPNPGGLPEVPADEACTVVDAQDVYVLRFGYLSFL